ncbi:UDP-glucuronosyl/UDP-glucosyltransferase [Dillenia turbinata]|uniref:Glycosyltransferase n=1 Tax=Dillenia turbinata TaxID=194707 RepID=A0AAN8UTT6_9MAGN
MSSEVKAIPTCHVVAMTYPGRGHINPMVDLCTHLVAASSGELLITLVLTEEWLGLIGSKQEPDSLAVPSPNIRFRSIPNVVPSELKRADDYSGFIRAIYTKMEDPFDRLLDQLEPPVTCIIADLFLPWMPAVGKRRNIPVALLFTMAPSLFSCYYHFDLLAAHRHSFLDDLSERGEEVIDYIPGISMRLANSPFFNLTERDIIINKLLLEAFPFVKDAQALLFSCFYDLEANVLNALRDTLPIPIYALGPSIPYLSLRNKTLETSHGAYQDWLDKQPEASVLYISLGSFGSKSKEQVHELLMGLNESGHRYFWAARSEALNLQQNANEKGLIVPWCDQLRILCHSSVGAYLSNCGWNSTLEGIYAGVPMLAYPQFAEQPYNSKLIAEVWKNGLNLKRNVGTQNTVGRDEIARAIKRIMDLNGEEGKGLRTRAKELQEACRTAIDAGGSTATNHADFLGKFCAI